MSSNGLMNNYMSSNELNSLYADYYNGINSQNILYLDGLTSNVQEQLNAFYVDISGIVVINGKNGIDGITPTFQIGTIESAINPYVNLISTFPNAYTMNFGIPSGQQGLPGIKGERGNQGISGLIGLPGIQGERGNQGISGLIGLQ